MSADLKNFLPGPTMVRPEVLAQLARPIIGHRTPEFRDMMARISPALQRLFRTQHPVFSFTCTASAAMEAALANAGGQNILILANGLFGERWGEAAKALGLKFEVLKFDWGVPLNPGRLEQKLKRGNYSSVVMVHGETSTGMLNPVEPISALTAQLEDVLLIVDAVATLGGVPLQMDEWGIDVLVGASQKCLALPPGIVPLGVSARAVERSRRSRRKGYAFDFTLWQERWANGEVVGTPAIPQLYALEYQLARIEKEGMEARWQRHSRLLALTQEWAQSHGWPPFSKAPEAALPQRGRGSMTGRTGTSAAEALLLPSVSCLIPPGNRDTTPLVATLRRRGYLVDEGHGRLKAQVVRIGHMGDWQEEDLEGLLRVLGEPHPEAR